MDTLDGEVHSEELKKAFGWTSPHRSQVLCYQLVELGKKYSELQQQGQVTSAMTTMAQAVPQIYALLQENIGTDDFISGVVAMQNRKVIWIDLTHGFELAQRVAVESSLSLKPILHTVSDDMIPFIPLLKQLGVKDTFSSTDLVTVLRTIQREQTKEGLDEATVSRCVAILSHLKEDDSLLASDRGSVPVPCAEVELGSGSVLLPGRQLCFDDAPWLAVSCTVPHICLNLAIWCVGRRLPAQAKPMAAAHLWCLFILQCTTNSRSTLDPRL